MSFPAYVPPELPADAAKAFAEGRHATHRTWFERASDLLGEAGGHAPDDPLVLAYATLVRRFLGHDPGAAVDRVRTLAASGEGPGRALAEAMAALAVRDHATALLRVQEFVEQRPDDPYGRHAVGFLLSDVGRPAEAVPVLEALLRVHPDFTPALNHLGYARLALGETPAAIATFRAFVAAEPDNPSARDSLADALVASGETDGAIAQLLRAVLVEPRYAFGWVHIASILESAGEPAVALPAYRSAIAAGGAYGPAFHANVEEQIERLARAHEPG